MKSDGFHVLFDRYGALRDDENAKQAMYWSSDGKQLVVADVSAYALTISLPNLRSLSVAETPGD